MGGDGSVAPEDVPGVPEAIQKVLDAAHSAGKAAGIFCMNSDAVVARFKQGFEFFNVGSELVGT